MDSSINELCVVIKAAWSDNKATVPMNNLGYIQDKVIGHDSNPPTTAWPKLTNIPTLLSLVRQAPVSCWILVAFLLHHIPKSKTNSSSSSRFRMVGTNSCSCQDFSVEKGQDFGMIHQRGGSPRWRWDVMACHGPGRCGAGLIHQGAIIYSLSMMDTHLEHHVFPRFPTLYYLEHKRSFSASPPIS